MRGHGNVDLHDAEMAADDLLQAVHVDRDHSIGYCGGYSKDGKTIYVDHDIDTKFKFGGKEAEIIKFLVVHECVEKALMEMYDLDYAPAHALATAAEDAVIAACYGPEAVKEYGKQWEKQIAKVVARKEHPTPPDDLDPRPYEDAADHKMMDKMDMDQRGGVLALLAKRDPMKAVARAGQYAPADEDDEPDDLDDVGGGKYATGRGTISRKGY